MFSVHNRIYIFIYFSFCCLILLLFCVYSFSTPIVWWQAYQYLILCTSMVNLGGLIVYDDAKEFMYLLKHFLVSSDPINLYSFYVSFYFNKMSFPSKCLVQQLGLFFFENIGNEGALFDCKYNEQHKNRWRLCSTCNVRCKLEPFVRLNVVVQQTLPSRYKRN